MAAGAALIVCLSAVVGGMFIAGEVGSLVNAIRQTPSLAVAPGQLASAGSGGPQTLLLVGDDQRALTKYYLHAVLPHSNEMLLVRFDPGKPYISMLSIPRDLLVTIYPPNAPAVTTRFNYAYTAGGIPTLLSTIERVIGLTVNHVVVITFPRFKRAVDELGCVYSTIDHRYYHSNVGSVQQYQEINLQPGYQKLCGPQALQYVSYRHGDTALVRDARDQSFLLDVKTQFGASLLANRDKFEQIFGRAVQTDPSLHTTSGLLGLLTTLASSSGRPVRQVPFQATIAPTAVTATPTQISQTVDAFLHGRQGAPQRHLRAVARALPRHRATIRLALAPTPAVELQAARAAVRTLPFTLEYPRVRGQAGAGQPSTLRTYYLRGEDGKLHPAYVAAVPDGVFDLYYDVQGTTWTSAPLLRNPDQTVRAGGRTYHLYYDAARLVMVAWFERGAAYWVRNSLTKSVGDSEMLAIAEETQPFTAAVAGPGRRRAGLGAFGLPSRPSRAATPDTLQAMGSIGGLVALLGIAALSIPFLGHRRELIALRARVRVRVQQDARERAAAYAAGVSPYANAADRARLRDAPTTRKRWRGRTRQ